jgi:hypothetical protein
MGVDKKGGDNFGFQNQDWQNHLEEIWLQRTDITFLR